MMDLKELTTFRTIIQEGTFSKAAEKLNYAQSTVTNQIQRLEKELGIKLFKRGWDAELTASGKIYAEEVDGLISHWNYVLEKAGSLQKEEIGTLRIGVIEPLTSSVLPAVLQSFRNQKPNINCQFIVGNTEALSHALTHNDLDFVISGEPNDLTDLQFEPLYEEQISFVVSEEHPFAKNSSLCLDDLFEYPLIVGGASCLYHIRLEKELSSFHSKPFYYTVSQISSIPSFVRSFPSVGVVLSSVALPSGIVATPILLKNPFISIGILQSKRKKYATSSQKLFMQLIKEQLSTN